MLSQTSEHALRAVLYLAQQPRRIPIPADVIARALGAPRNYLAKTLNALAKERVLGSVRGPSGGFWLAVSPAELTLARIIQTFDEPRPRQVCLIGGRPCTDHAPCAVHFRWKAITEEVAMPLRHTTVADLLDGDFPGVSDAPGRSPATVLPG